MTEAQQREDVERVARQWVGLPYVDGARIRHVCGDCTFIALVYEDAGLIDHVEVPDYSPQAHLHRTGGLYIAAVRERARETDDPKTGDLVMYWFGRDFSHGAIIVSPGWPHIIHADKAAKRIIEADGSQGSLLLANQRKFFTLW